MISVNRLLDRKMSFPVNDWIMDCGFTRLAAGKGYLSTRKYAAQILRWQRCGNLTAAIAQDYVCTPAAFAATGLDVQTHQKLSVLRYDNLYDLLARKSDEANYLQYCMDAGDRFGEVKIAEPSYDSRLLSRMNRGASKVPLFFKPFLGDEEQDWLENYEELKFFEPEMEIRPDTFLMPVLQGTNPDEYLRHIDLYSWRLDEGMWVGVGGLKSKTPEQVEAILIAIKTYFPSLKLHGLGVTAKALRRSHIWHLLSSADSQAHGIAKGRGKQKYAGSNDPKVALEYMQSLFASAPRQLSLFAHLSNSPPIPVLPQSKMLNSRRS